jgi:hypothetical protein
VLLAVGSVLVLVGGIAAIAGPLDMYCFALFLEGGRFHYDGFGFGSFMFGNIACQIIGYYAIAAIFIPLGYGHLRLRRWARPFALAVLWSWLVLGIPLSIAFLFVLFTGKELSVTGAAVALIGVCLAYPLVPGLMIRFYRGRHVTSTFERAERYSTWIERLPVPIMVLGMLFAFYVLVLHVLILFNGVFPLFGIWLTGLPGIAVIDVGILCLVGLLWGVLRQQRWAWWGSLVYFTTMTASWSLTLATSTWSGILAALAFPPFEMAILRGIPLQGAHFAALAGVHLVLTLIAILRARDSF